MTPLDQARAETDVAREQPDGGLTRSTTALRLASERRITDDLLRDKDAEIRDLNLRLKNAYLDREALAKALALEKPHALSMLDRIASLESEIAKLKAVAEAAKAVNDDPNCDCGPENDDTLCSACEARQELYTALTRLAEKDGGK
jgi:hypothetical protein